MTLIAKTEGIINCLTGRQYLFSAAAVFLAITGLASCGSSDEPAPGPDPSAPGQRTVLIYSIGSNSLQSDLAADREEMEASAKSITGLCRDVNVLIYFLDHDNAPALYELKPEDSSFHLVKQYDRSRFSTDPQRISEVISDAARLRPAANYGLVMSSHATGWSPDFSTHTVPVKKSFGQDKYEGASDYCDITELAEAIPDGMMDFIWFDCCYMSSIEVAYQLRDKCETMVAYPTEVWQWGMPYDKTLPLIASVKPRLREAAEELFNWYEQKGMAATIAVLDMAEIEGVARTAHAIYAAGIRPSATGLLKYSRRAIGPFYDFGQYTREHVSGNADSEKLRADFAATMDKFVTLALATPYDLNDNPWNLDNYSGLSCHMPETTNQASEDYYHTLDWSKAVYSR